MKRLYTRVVIKAASEEIHQCNSKKRTRNILWFNPPFSQTVKTNVAKTFFRLLDKHFPKSHSLHKILNRNNTIKVSYSCMNNVSEIIKQHNKNVSNKKVNQTNPCNCRNMRPWTSLFLEVLEVATRIEIHCRCFLRDKLWDNLTSKSFKKLSIVESLLN